MLYKDAVYKDAVQECLEAEGVRFTKKTRPLDGGITVARYADANVESFDDYTSQGRPSLHP